MEQIGQAIRQNADTVRVTNQQAATASEIAAKGGEAIENIVRTMDEISQSSRKISEIIAVIDGITFQTNILALNAAVEAARAGQGPGLRGGGRRSTFAWHSVLRLRQKRLRR
jgi:methyl-accepting chemotaxis protein